MKWWDWTRGIARCPSGWIEPGRTFQCEQDQGHDGNHYYRDWQWDSERRGRRRKVEARVVVNPPARHPIGMQPARVQLVPPVRPAGHQIKPSKTGGRP